MDPSEANIQGAQVQAEAQFQAIGVGARTWLLEAASVGTVRMNQKMAEAVALAKKAGTEEVDTALGTAAIHHKFATGSLASILNAATDRTGNHAAGEGNSLGPGHRRLGRDRWPTAGDCRARWNR